MEIPGEADKTGNSKKRDGNHTYPMNVEAEESFLGPEDDDSWLEQAEAVAEIWADWETEEG